MPAVVRDVHGGSATAKVLLDLRQTIAAGSSPFHKDETVTQPDTSRTASCTCCTPPARFVTTGGRTAEEWVDLHVERERLPKLPNVPASGAEAIERVRATITDRISNGDLKVGQVVRQIELARELRVHSKWMSHAIGQLVAAGTLGYIGSGSARRAVVV